MKGACNAGSLSVNGVIEGVIHKMWMPEGDKDEMQHGMTVLHVADGPTLAERKKLLCEHSDAFIVLPGGPGTYDELWEVISEFQLGLPKGKCPRPVCLVNVDGYYDPTIMQLQRCYDDGMLYKEVSEVIHHEPDAASALSYIVNAVSLMRETFEKKTVAETITDEVRKQSTL
jgi:predicted Rossmann-fold nucleotide-binding protein